MLINPVDRPIIAVIAALISAVKALIHPVVTPVEAVIRALVAALKALITALVSVREALIRPLVAAAGTRIAPLASAPIHSLLRATILNRFAASFLTHLRHRLRASVGAGLRASVRP
ncbi:MAG: hypothetical protein RIA71_11270 [Oceanicaulis sp.]